MPGKPKMKTTTKSKTPKLQNSQAAHALAVRLSCALASLAEGDPDTAITLCNEALHCDNGPLPLDGRRSIVKARDEADCGSVREAEFILHALIDDLLPKPQFGKGDKKMADKKISGAGSYLPVSSAAPRRAVFTFSDCGKAIDQYGKTVLSVDPCGNYRDKRALAERLCGLLNRGHGATGKAVQS